MCKAHSPITNTRRGQRMHCNNALRHIQPLIIRRIRQFPIDPMRWEALPRRIVAKLHQPLAATPAIHRCLVPRLKGLHHTAITQGPSCKVAVDQAQVAPVNSGHCQGRADPICKILPAVNVPAALDVWRGGRCICHRSAPSVSGVRHAHGHQPFIRNAQAQNPQAIGCNHPSSAHWFSNSRTLGLSRDTALALKPR